MKLTTGSVIGILVALVVGVPILLAMFGSGGPFDELDQLGGGGYCATTGSATFASTAFNALTFTEGGSLQAIPDGRKVSKGTVTLTPYSVTTAGATNRSSVATWGIGTYPYAAIGTSTAITCGDSAVAAVPYASNAGNIGLTAFVPNAVGSSTYQPIIAALIGLALLFVIVAAVLIIASKARR